MSLEFGYSLRHVVASAMAAVSISVARWFESFVVDLLSRVADPQASYWIQMATSISDARHMLKLYFAGLHASPE